MYIWIPPSGFWFLVSSVESNNKKRTLRILGEGRCLPSYLVACHSPVILAQGAVLNNQDRRFAALWIIYCKVHQKKTDSAHYMFVYTKASGGTPVSTYVFFGVLFFRFITKQPSRENIPVIRPRHSWFNMKIMFLGGKPYKFMFSRSQNMEHHVVWVTNYETACFLDHKLWKIRVS